MKKLFKSILGGEQSDPAAAIDSAGDAAKAQGLRLELDEAKRQIDTLKAELDRARQAESATTDETRQAEREALAKAVATPLAQILAQEKLLAGGTQVAASDVAKAARSLVNACLSQGLELVDEAGARTTYDPARHAPLSGGGLNAGDAILVRFPGLAAGIRVVKKAAVEAAAKTQEGS